MSERDIYLNENRSIFEECQDLHARVAELETALRGVMSLGYIDQGWWKVATPIDTDALTDARVALMVVR